MTNMVGGGIRCSGAAPSSSSQSGLKPKDFIERNEEA